MRTGSPTNIYLDDAVKAQASKLAFREDISLSALIERELGRYIARRQKKAAKAAAKAAALKIAA